MYQKKLVGDTTYGAKEEIIHKLHANTSKSKAKEQGVD